MILLDISGANATLREQDTLTCGMVGAKVRFRFDGAWDGLSKTAVFRCGKVTRDSLLTGDTAVIPHEVLTAPGLPLQIGVYGTDEGGALVIPTLWAATCPVRPGADPSGDTGADPTLPVWAQIRAKAETNGQSIGELTGQVDALRRQAADTIVPPPIVETAAGMTVSAPNSAERPLQGLTLYGKTTQDGTPTPDAPVALESVGGSGEINVAVCGENKEPQTLLASTPNGLPGIPVSSGGNYTDENGQQWICDEIDFARGVYVRRIAEICLDGSTPPNQYVQTGNAMRFGWTGEPGFTPKDYTNAELAMCNRFTPSVSPIWNNYLDGGICAHTGGNIYLRYDAMSSPEAMAEYLAGNPVVYLYVMKTPIETPLSADELSAFAALHTNYPNTTVSNDAGAGMEMKYVADTKLYIDRQFTQLQNAILSSGANV